jgi:hypothetical protein
MHGITLQTNTPLVAGDGLAIVVPPMTSTTDEGIVVSQPTCALAFVAFELKDPKQWLQSQPTALAKAFDKIAICAAQTGGYLSSLSVYNRGICVRP